MAHDEDVMEEDDAVMEEDGTLEDDTVMPVIDKQNPILDYWNDAHLEIGIVRGRGKFRFLDRHSKPKPIFHT